MGLEVTQHARGEERRTTVGLFVATEKLWLNAAGDVVADGDPAAAFLYLAPGDEIPLAEAEAKGLVKPKAAPKPKPEPPAKQAEKPADKQRKPKADK